MRTGWISVSLAFVVLGCQSTPTDQSTTPELARPMDEPVAVSVAIGGVT